MKCNYYLVGLVLLTFFTTSFLTNIIGPLTPAIVEDFDPSLTLVAVLPFAFFAAPAFDALIGVLRERAYEAAVAGR